jgi:hypothetical protein
MGALVSALGLVQVCGCQCDGVCCVCSLRAYLSSPSDCDTSLCWLPRWSISSRLHGVSGGDLHRCGLSIDVCVCMWVSSCVFYCYVCLLLSLARVLVCAVTFDLHLFVFLFLRVFDCSMFRIISLCRMPCWPTSGRVHWCQRWDLYRCVGVSVIQLAVGFWFVCVFVSVCFEPSHDCDTSLCWLPRWPISRKLHGVVARNL